MSTATQDFVLQAIETRFFGPTNARGSRVKAIADAGNLTVEWDHSINSEQNHRSAANALRDKLGWKGELIGGSLPGNHSGYAWVFLPRTFA